MIFGYSGSICASLLFFPQVWTSYKTKQTKSLSWLSIIIGLLNGLSWVGYGLLKNDPIIWVTNSLVFTGVFLLMLLKKKYG